MVRATATRLGGGLSRGVRTYLEADPGSTAALEENSRRESKAQLSSVPIRDSLQCCWGPALHHGGDALAPSSVLLGSPGVQLNDGPAARLIRKI